MKYLIILLLSFPVFSQNYSLETGMVIPKDKDYQLGYYIEVNFLIETNLNRKMIFGVSHGGYMTDNAVISAKEFETKECNCTQTDIGFGNNNQPKRMVRTVSLIFGLEALKRFYLTTGITSAKHITKDVSGYYSTHIDFGAKYFIKINNGFLTINTKFNPEQVSVGVGYSR